MFEIMLERLISIICFMLLIAAVVISSTIIFDISKWIINLIRKIFKI